MNIVHVQCSLHLLKARTMMDNIFLSHSYILVFPPKSLFSITLILICITLSLVTLLGNPFSSHFIALCCKRNVIYFICCKITRIVPRDCLQGGLSTGGNIQGDYTQGDYTQGKLYTEGVCMECHLARFYQDLAKILSGSDKILAKTCVISEYLS